MKYRFTVLNIASGLVLIGILIYAIINSEEILEGEVWHISIMIELLVVVVAGFLIDFIIRVLAKKLEWQRRRLIENLLGALVLIMVYYIHRNHARDLKIYVPDGYTASVGLVYNVPGAPELPVNILTLNSATELPDDGIILTGSNIRYNDIPHTKFYRTNGSELLISDPWNKYSDEISFNCNGRTLTIRIIFLGEGNGRDYIDKKLDHIREKLRKFCANSG